MKSTYLLLFVNLFLLALLSKFTVVNGTDGTKGNLTLGLFISRSGTVVYEGVLPAINLALRLVNEDPNILPDYVLGYDDVVDSVCSTAPTVRGFVNNLFNLPTKVMVIGPDCSTSTQSVAELAPFWELVQISFAAASISLSDTELYPKFLRTIPADDVVPQGMIAVMKQFEWENFGIVTQQEDAFTSAASALQRQAKQYDINLLHMASFNSGRDPKPSLSQLVMSGARIIFLNVNVNYAVDILCAAVNMKLTASDYVWISYGWYFENFWEDPDGSSTFSNCTSEQLKNIINRNMLFLSTNPLDDRNCKEIVGGLAKNNFSSECCEILNGSNVKPRLIEAQFAYDSIWTAAIALNATEDTLRTMGTSLAEFTYDSTNISDILWNKTLSVEFCGASGYVNFDEKGNRIPFLHLQQLRKQGNDDLVRVSLANISVERQSLDFQPGYIDQNVFQGDTPMDKEVLLIPIPLFGVYISLMCLGILFALVCLTFTVVFRNKLIVKNTLPFVNVGFCIGSVMAYLVVMFLGIDENYVTDALFSCHLTIWFAAIAFSLMYGSLLAKAWRIYYVYYHFKLHKIKKEVSYLWLLLIVLILVLVDLAFLILVTAVPPARLYRCRFEVLGKNDGRLPQYHYFCTSEGFGVWFPVMLALKAVQLLVGVYLAFEIRNVNIKELNESKLISLSMYGMFILGIALTPLGYFLNLHAAVRYGTIGALLLISITLLLGILFLPKMIALCKDPSGERDLGLYGLQTVQTTSWTIGSGNPDDPLENELKDLKDELHKLTCSDGSDD